MTSNMKMVPPDGGWGWVVMFAFVLSNFIYIPVLQNFGLMFKETFKTMNLSGTNITSIISTNAAMSSLIGTVTGPLLKRYSIRQVSFMGAVLFSIGIISLSFANNYIHFLIAYGFIAGCGIGILRLTSGLSLNLYFQRRRRKIAGISLSLRSLGSMIAPPVIILSLEIYGIRSTALLIGGICLHTLCSALLLQPVEWHMHEVPYDNDKITCNNTYEQLVLVRRESQIGLYNNRRNSIGGRGSIRRESEIGLEVDKKLIYERRGSIRRGSKIALEVENKQTDEQQGLIKLESTNAIPVDEMHVFIAEDNKTNHQHILKKIVDTFDLTLLLNPIFLSITIGMLFSVYADSSFSTLFALIMSDLGFDDNTIATFISTSYISNVIVRIILPFIGDYFKMSSRLMYLLSCIMVILGRFAIIYFSQMGAITFIAITWGAAKAGRAVYWAVIMADNMPAHKLAAAESIQMVMNGIVVLTCGPLLGVVKDITGSYVSCIYVLNAVTGVTCLLWTTEMIYYKIKKTQKNVN